MEGSLVAYKVFTNGSVLQASEINDNLMRQAVMVFSNSAARTAAITLPLAGMLTYLEDVGLYETYTGTSWVSPFSFTLIKSQVIGTAVSSVIVTDAFSANFDNYKIMVSGGVGSVAQNIGLRLGGAATGYYAGGTDTTYSSAAVAGANVNNGASWTFAGVMNTTGIHFNVELLNPFLTTRTTFSCARPSLATNQGAIQASGFLNDATSYNNFTLLPAGTLTGGTISVYGFRKA